MSKGNEEYLNIPGYKIEKILGKGGMGVVYLAQQTALNRKVALKVTLPQLVVEDPSFAKRFVLEAKATAALDHDNIIRVYDAGVFENSSYMAMQYVSTGDLTELCKKPLTHQRICELFIGISAGLGAAHKTGFVHRDIKPDNILINEKGEPLLTDFGIVKTLSEEHTNLTLAGGAIGTPKYMSPEQIQAKKLDGRSDLYSLGVMLFGVLEKELPFIDATPMAICVKHITVAPPPLSNTNHLFQPIVSKLLEKNPDDRFKDAKQLIIALKRLLKYLNNPNSQTHVFVSQKGRQHSGSEPMLERTLKIDDFDNGLTRNKFLKLLVSLLVLLVILGVWYYISREQLSRNDGDIPNSVVKVKKDDINQNDKGEYLLATNKNTVEAYNIYLNKYPKGKFVKQAQRFINNINKQKKDLEDNILKLKDEESWNMAKVINSAKAYQEYLKKHPKGSFLKLAQQKINSLSKKSTKPKKISKTSRISQLLKTAQKYQKQFNLLSPQGKNAYEAYQQVLTLDKDNSLAKQGILEIIYQYFQLAQNKGEAKEYAMALNYINNAIKLRKAYLADLYGKDEFFGMPVTSLVMLNKLKQTIEKDSQVASPQIENPNSKEQDTGAEDYFSRGVKAYKSKNYKQAAKWLLQPAEQNNEIAQLYLGSLYYSGQGVTQNYDKAIEWYEKAANQNNVKAQTYLGLMYEQGKGVKKDYSKALNWFQKAASLNHASAQNSLGYFFQEGLGTKKDLGKALKWYGKAADQNYVIAQKQLGLMNLRGIGLRKSTKKAFQWYQKAAMLNDPEAQDIIGNMYEIGKGVKKDNVKSVDWYKKAAKQGYEQSIKNLQLRGITDYY